MATHYRTLLLWTSLFCLSDSPSPAQDTRPLTYNRDIRPILAETCFPCHGPDERARKADLRLDSAAGATADLGGYQPIVPGELESSEVWKRIVSPDADRLMPPPESHLTVTDEQRQLIRRWIKEGAKYEGHWAFQSPVQPAVPESVGEDGNQAIDAFVRAALADNGLTAAAQADPRTLIRRLTFDLLGLPPSVDEVNEFVSSYQARGEAVWQDAITRLLASPHFGERMAVPWLDQARYADTNGYSIDGGRQMWLWRDWVINAYNTNLPFDQFLLHQIAGDLLPGATDAERIATGFNRNHMNTHEGGTIPAENLTNYAADRVKTTSEVFLGLTMGCAQCHDHKYDPISQREYYQFMAFFNELDDKGLDGNSGINSGPSVEAQTVLPIGELPVLAAELAELKHRLSTATTGFDAWLAQVRLNESKRGDRFELSPGETLDVSSPNFRGPIEIEADSSIFLQAPGKGLDAFSHAIRLPANKIVAGIRISFIPYALPIPKPSSETTVDTATTAVADPISPQASLTPFKDAVPKVTTVLISAGEQPAKQVEYYRQIAFSQATASSSTADNQALHVLDERNDQHWRPANGATEQHLTLTFRDPIDSSKSRFLTVLLVFGVNDSIPYHWKIEPFSGQDTDSVFDNAVTNAIAKPEQDWSEDDREVVLQAFRERSPGLERLRIRIANLHERTEVLTKSHSTMVMNTAAKPRETFVLARGQYDAPQEKVTPGTLVALPPLNVAAEATKATRLDLAKWMIDPHHPLTSRVLVNRLWSQFFGNGIVASSADFGSQGAYPSHPELLDYLATEFVAGGWDQKALIRQIVSSHTYRQDSTVSAEAGKRDPENRWLARGPRFRLSAEFIRDQALATSGLLVTRIGGPSVFPYQPPGLWKEISHFGSTPATLQVFVQDRGEKLYRRSLYTAAKRTSPHPSMSAFDAPNRELCTVQRGITNTPMQALVTLNDVQFTEAARVFAAKLLRETPHQDERERLNTAFATFTSRLPTAEEAKHLERFLADRKLHYQRDTAAAAEVVSVGEAELDPLLDVASHAAWTQVASLLLNLSESLTRK